MRQGALDGFKRHVKAAISHVAPHDLHLIDTTMASRADPWPCCLRDALRQSDGVRAESQRALDGLKGEFEALTRELTAEGGANASWSAASSGLPQGMNQIPLASTSSWHTPSQSSSGWW